MASRSMFAYAILYLALFGALGAEVSFLPYYLATAGLSARQIGVVLTAGTITQVIVAPLFGLAADRFGTRRVLGASAVAAAAGFPLFLAVPAGARYAFAVNVLFALTTAPLNPLADALSVPACLQARVPYGLIRGMGSVGFFAGILISSTVTARLGVIGIVPTTAILLGFVALTVPALPPAVRTIAPDNAGVLFVPAFMALWANPPFQRVLLVASLVIGGHAMSDAFAVIHWTAIGIGAQTIGILLATAVGSECLVFVALGPMLLRNLGPSACAAIGAVAGIVRWGIVAEAQSIWLLVAAQLLHGLTFSLVHLACMQVLAIAAPRRFFATAQSLYGICCNAIASSAITLAAGAMFAIVQAQAFWLVSALCFLALPIALRLGVPAGELVETDGARAG